MVKRLCIDAGHGDRNSGDRYDPGAVSAGVAEATVALQYALTLKAEALSRGLKVFLSRDDAEDDTPVSERGAKANAAGCSHFVSLHLNSAENPQAHGFEIIYRDTQDKKFAESLHLQLAPVFAKCGIRSRGLKHESETARGRLAIFSFNGPAVILELFFVSNQKDREAGLLRSTRIAVCDGIIDACIGEDGNDGMG